MGSTVDREGLYSPEACRRMAGEDGRTNTHSRPRLGLANLGSNQDQTCIKGEHKVRNPCRSSSGPTKSVAGGRRRRRRPKNIHLEHHESKFGASRIQRLPGQTKMIGMLLKEFRTHLGWLAGDWSDTAAELGLLKGCNYLGSKPHVNFCMKVHGRAK